jgi:hypothetical protein
MANTLYGKSRRAFGTKQIDWVNDAVSAILVSGAYTPDLVNDEFLSAIPGGAIVAAAQPITVKTVSAAGVFDGGDLLFPAVSGAPILYVIGYLDTGVPGTSILIPFFDTIAGFLPYTPSGLDVPIIWDAAGIFSWTGC